MSPIRCAGVGALAAGLFALGMAAANAAGAIAIGSCAAYGYAFDYADAARARAAALGKCSGKGCRVVATIARGCAAFAIDGQNACGAHGYAVSARLGRAQNAALRQCYRFGGRNCVIRAWACDGKG